MLASSSQMRYRPFFERLARARSLARRRRPFIHPSSLFSFSSSLFFFFFFSQHPPFVLSFFPVFWLSLSLFFLSTFLPRTSSVSRPGGSGKMAAVANAVKVRGK